jgi:transcription-repair coupling factor (superfamily II helicase)
MNAEQAAVEKSCFTRKSPFFIISAFLRRVISGNIPFIMNLDTLKDALRRWSGMTGAFSRLQEESWPCEIEGLQGGMHAFFLSEYARLNAGLLVVVVPTEKDVEVVHADLELGGLESTVLPWWGSIAYRPVATGSSVFGERAAALATMCASAAPRSEALSVIVMTERAFLTPLPPPEYVASLLSVVTVGSSFDPASFASTLSGQGYVRVPRVTVRGEFALRGEVLDVFLPGEPYAYRIVFDFDRVEKDLPL